MFAQVRFMADQKRRQQATDRDEQPHDTERAPELGNVTGETTEGNVIGRGGDTVVHDSITHGTPDNPSLEDEVDRRVP